MNLHVPGDQDTLEAGKLYLREHWEDKDGIDCPGCGQKVKLYPRAPHATMVRTLIELYKVDLRKPNQYIPYREFNGWNPSTGMGDFGKWKLWGLAVDSANDPEDTAQRTSGNWAITEKGRRFVRGEVKIPKHIYIFNKRVRRVSHELIDVHEALNKRYDYNEIMEATNGGN